MTTAAAPLIVELTWHHDLTGTAPDHRPPRRPRFRPQAAGGWILTGDHGQALGVHLGPFEQRNDPRIALGWAGGVLSTTAEPPLPVAWAEQDGFATRIGRRWVGAITPALPPTPIPAGDALAAAGAAEDAIGRADRAAREGDLLTALIEVLEHLGRASGRDLARRLRIQQQLQPT